MLIGIALIACGEAGDGRWQSEHARAGLFAATPDPGDEKELSGTPVPSSSRQDVQSTTTSANNEDAGTNDANSEATARTAPTGSETFDPWVFVDWFRTEPLNKRRTKLIDHCPFTSQGLTIAKFHWDDDGTLNIFFADMQRDEKPMKLFVHSESYGENSYSFGDEGPEALRVFLVEQLQIRRNNVRAGGWGTHADYVRDVKYKFISSDGRPYYDVAYEVNVVPLAPSFIDTPTGTRIANSYIVARGATRQNWNIFYSHNNDFPAPIGFSARHKLIGDFNKLSTVAKRNLDLILRYLRDPYTGDGWSWDFKTLTLQRVDSIDEEPVRKVVDLSGWPTELRDAEAWRLRDAYWRREIDTPTSSYSHATGLERESAKGTDFSPPG